MNHNKELLDQFVAYCEQHPEQRFWQALCNWDGVSVLASLKGDATPKDTFSFRNKLS